MSNKIEEAAREFISNTDYASYLEPEDCERIAKYMADFHKSQSKSLESKVKELNQKLNEQTDETRDQFKEMVTYLMDEGTDNEVIESYVDTFMLIHNEQTLTLESKIDESFEEEKDKWLSMYYEASTSLDIQAEKLMEKQKRIEGLSKFIMNMNLFDEYCKWKDTEL